MAKQIMFINGSPRRNGNTATLLREAMHGAESLGAETKLVNLIDLKFSGCVSCFYCKQKDAPHGHCLVKDDISPILEEIRNVDAVVFGAPIYFMNVPALLGAFLERLLFSNYLYDLEKPSCFGKKIPSAYIYTMNLDEKGMEHFHVESMLYPFQSYTGMMLGRKPKILYACDTWQFPDYSKFESKIFNVAKKEEARRTRWPQDKLRAFELGKELAAEK